MSVKRSVIMAIVGGGQMGGAFVSGLIKAKVLAHGSKIHISDPFTDLTKYKQMAPNMVETYKDNIKAISNADIVVLAVKPQIIDKVMIPLKNYWKSNQIIVTIVTGVTFETYKSYFNDNFKPKIIRMMPNTPVTVQAMAAGIVPGQYCTKEEVSLITTIFQSLGVVRTFPDEKYLDYVTGLSGSGPAYVFMFIEALADGGVLVGLHRKDALELAIQLVLGSAKYIKEKKLHPGILKDEVCSPGGTTIEAVNELERNKFRHAVIEAVKASTNKSILLGKQKIEQMKRKQSKI